MVVPTDVHKTMHSRHLLFVIHVYLRIFFSDITSILAIALSSVTFKVDKVLII